MAIIFIIIIIGVLYFLFFYKKKESKSIPITEKISESEISLDLDKNGLEDISIEEPTFRYSYIKANLKGKYYGTINQSISNQFVKSSFFDFHIYEVTLNNTVYSSSKFFLEEDFRIPRQKLPKLLHIVLEKDGKEYEVDLHQPSLSNIKFNRKLHQQEGDQVFGTIDAIVTGYVCDFSIECCTENEYILNSSDGISQLSTVDTVLTETNTPTANVELNNNYESIDSSSDSNKTYRSDWNKKPFVSNNRGFSFIAWLIVLLFGLIFFFMMLPRLLYILPFFLIVFLLNIVSPKIYTWFFQIIGILFLIIFFVSLFQIITHSTNTFIPKPKIVENLKEQEIQTIPIIDTNNTIKNDTLIKHFRAWNDYQGNKYQGYIWTKSSDYNKSKYYKNNLNLSGNTSVSYDEIVYLLTENDKYNLTGVYQLFDSIRINNHLSNVKFAEIIVSFVQDVPYAIILPNDCNPNLYDDKFIQDYLNSENSRCLGFQKFGINSPVEFMSNFYGDCDTRTLLLYTILAHYGYDVAVFSSEYYGHSVLGVNLPLNGLAYKYHNQRYVLWETTSPNLKAGVLPKEISNLNYWRISLKSK